MIITARLKRHSRIWKMWRGHNRVSGAVHSVMFRWMLDNNYSTGPLTKEEIALLHGHSDVEMELSGNAELFDEVQPVDEPEADGTTLLSAIEVEPGIEASDAVQPVDEPEADGATKTSAESQGEPETPPEPAIESEASTADLSNAKTSDSPKEPAPAPSNEKAKAAIAAALGANPAGPASLRPVTVDRLPPVPAFVRRAQQRGK